ncbi:MAG: hypothetical protein AAF333_16680 [Planctomycetota bacterium]
MTPLRSFRRPLPGCLLLLFVCVGVALGPTAIAGPAPTKPDGFLPEHQVTSGVYASFELGGLVITPDTIRVYLWGDPDAGTLSTLELRIDRIDRDGDKPVLRTVVTDYQERLNTTPRFRRGEALPLEVSFDRFGRLELKPLSEAQLGRNQPTWRGARPPAGWPQHADIPEKADAGPLGILGPWAASLSWSVRLGPDQLSFATGQWPAARFDIVEWTPVQGEDFVRLDTDYVQGYDQRLIDEQVRMLLRHDANGFSVAFFPPEAGRPDDWPTSFTHSPDNPVQVISFAPGAE